MKNDTELKSGGGSSDRTASQEWEGVLADFENAVVAPVVPGELEDWTNTTEAAFRNLQTVYEQKIAETHEEQFRQMSEQDEEMLPRIEDLRQEDAEIAGLLKAFRLRLNHFGRIAEDKQSAPADLDDKRGEVSDEASELVRRIRTQEAALNTWFSEAFMRDRGPVD